MRFYFGSLLVLMLNGILSFRVLACTDVDLTLKAEHRPNTEAAWVNVTKWTDKTASSSKSIIILPPTGGTNIIDRRYASQFCRAGFDVYVLNRWTGDVGTRTDLDIHQGFYTAMLEAVKLTLNQIDTRFVGVLGTSLGGLFASVAASKFDRLDAVFVIAAGTPIADIIVSSDQEAMRKLAATRSERFGLDTPEKYRTALNEAFLLEPTKQPPLSKKINFGMVVSEADTTVPTDYQHRLREFWKPMKVISIESNHFWTIVKTWLFHSDEVLDFFENSAKAAPLSF